MKPLLFALLALPAMAHASSGGDLLCEAALSAVSRFAESRGWQAEAHCRKSAGASLPADSALLPIDPPAGAPLRSGPSAWAVRVQASSRASYVQRVPIYVAWTAPAWVSRDELLAGATLQAGDVELRMWRWPDGVIVNAAHVEAPLSGRLRQSIHGGELMTSAHLVPAELLMRGDRVTAVLTEGGMEIRMPVQLLMAARVGQRVRAQVLGRAVALDGLLADAQTLRVDSQ